MSDPSFISGTRAGTVSGTLLVLISSLNLADILDTAILAAIGASVSFIVSLIWKRVGKKWRSKG